MRSGQWCTGALILLCAATASSGTLEEVIVTASLDEDDYKEMPAITLVRKADFLVQKVQFVNDSRSPELRRKEIFDSIARFIQSARKETGIELSYGEGFLLPVDLTNDSLQLINDRQRVDTSRIDIFVKSAVVDTGSIKPQIGRLRTFIAEQKLVGRTEMESSGDIGLSIVGPEQYRYEILKKITEENERVRTIVGGACAVTLSGLERRVSWQRTSVDELTLYVPYGSEMKCGG